MKEYPEKRNVTWIDCETGLQCGECEYIRADIVEELEAKLAKAVEALQGLVPILCEGFEDGCGKLSRHDCAACEGYATLAELTGGQKDVG